MTNEQLSKQLEQLKSFVVQSNEQIKVAEQSVNLSIEAMMNNTGQNDLKTVQGHVVNIKKLLNKAKKGENIQNEVDTFTKNIKRDIQSKFVVKSKFYLSREARRNILSEYLHVKCKV